MGKAFPFPIAALFCRWLIGRRSLSESNGKEYPLSSSLTPDSKVNRVNRPRCSFLIPQEMRSSSKRSKTLPASCLQPKTPAPPDSTCGCLVGARRQALAELRSQVWKTRGGTAPFELLHIGE